MNYINSVLELNRLLGLRFIWDGEEYKSVGARTPIGEAVIMIGVFHNERDYISRNVEIAKLMMLVKDLQTIEKHDPILLSRFKKLICNTRKDWGTYFGVRLEINIAASLIRKEVNFVKGESPDFIIPKYGVCIECTNTHRSKSGSAILIEKIRSAIKQKSKKTYCNSSTLLCIDITNVAATYDESENRLLAQKDGLRRVVRQILEDTSSNYGGILLFQYFMDLEDCFHSGYWRVDNENISPSLLAFLNEYFPLGEFKTGPGWTPRAG